MPDQHTHGLHVDIIRNDFDRSEQIRVASCTVGDDGALNVEAASERERWVGMVNEAAGKLQTPDGSEQLEGLHYVMRGDYLFATTVHEGSECPFDMPREMPPVEVGADQHTPHAAAS